MAQPSNITIVARSRVTELIEDLYKVDPLLSLIEDVAATDPLRIAFYEQYLEDEFGQPTTDITSAEFFAAVTALRSLRTWLVTNRPILAKLRI